MQTTTNPWQASRPHIPQISDAHVNLAVRYFVITVSHFPTVNDDFLPWKLQVSPGSLRLTRFIPHGKWTPLPKLCPYVYIIGMAQNCMTMKQWFNAQRRNYRKDCDEQSTLNIQAWTYLEEFPIAVQMSAYLTRSWDDAHGLSTVSGRVRLQNVASSIRHLISLNKIITWSGRWWWLLAQLV